MTILELGNLFSNTLSPFYSKSEVRALFHIYVKEKLGLDAHEIYLGEKNIPENLDYKSDLQRLVRGEPVQYVLGSAEFYGLRFEVAPSVLIPRPETEELVEKVVSEEKGRGAVKILDIGTGSGAIAVALSRNLPAAEVWAADCSAAALRMARHNAEILNVGVKFILWDIFNDVPQELPQFDIIVSNPPYIPENEKSIMSPIVTAYEPETALFVPDDDPVCFYKRIASLSRTLLASGGRVYAEIHESYPAESAAAFDNGDFRDIEVVKDINGKARFVFCQKK